MKHRTSNQPLHFTTAITLVVSFAHWSPLLAQDSWNGGAAPYTATSSAWNSGWGVNGWPGAPAANRQWRLGIEGTNTELGVLVNRVTPNSPAALAGINPMDVIVCVAGTQVGQVAGRVFDLPEVVNQYADTNGLIQLLVQDGRSLRLRSMRVQLDARQAVLTGMVVVPNGRLPADAIVTVQLENMSRPHYVVRNGEVSFRVPSFSGGQIPFTVNYDPNYIFGDDTYQIRAYITSRGQTIFDTRQPQYVLTKGNPSTVQLRVMPVSYTAASGAAGGNNGFVVSAGYVNYDSISQQVTLAYERYLGRRPSALEQAAWHQLPNIDYRLTRLPLELMGSQEYFDRVGNNNIVWVRTVIGEMIGRAPTELELDRWMRRFAELRFSRMDLLNQMQSVLVQ